MKRDADVVNVLKGLFDVEYGYTVRLFSAVMECPEEGAKEEKKPCVFFRARKRAAGNIRGRVTRKEDSSEDSDSDSDADGGGGRSPGGSGDEGNVAVVIKKKRRPAGLAVGRSEKIKRRRGDSDSSDSSSDSDGPSVPRVGVTFKGTGDAPAARGDQGATATLEIDTAVDRDARAVEERSRAERDKVAAADNPLEDRTYRGLKGYAKFVEKKDSAAGSAAKMSTGPQRAPSNVRATVRWDYAPDICKDYKETGFCGFGDSCKFMHDRSDYKFGWQLEREMQDGTYGADDDDDTKYEISSDEEDLPFKCFICKESFKHPVVTKCKHYFCEQCALAHYRKSQRCFACGRQTNGVFNPAKEIVAKMDKLKREEEAQEAKKEIRDDSDEDSD